MLQHQQLLRMLSWRLSTAKNRNRLQQRRRRWRLRGNRAAQLTAGASCGCRTTSVRAVSDWFMHASAARKCVAGLDFTTAQIAQNARFARDHELTECSHARHVFFCVPLVAQNDPTVAAQRTTLSRRNAVGCVCLSVFVVKLHHGQTNLREENRSHSGELRVRFVNDTTQLMLC